MGQALCGSRHSLRLQTAADIRNGRSQHHEGKSYKTSELDLPAPRIFFPIPDSIRRRENLEPADVTCAVRTSGGPPLRERRLSATKPSYDGEIDMNMCVKSHLLVRTRGIDTQGEIILQNGKCRNDRKQTYSKAHGAPVITCFQNCSEVKL